MSDRSLHRCRRSSVLRPCCRCHGASWKFTRSFDRAARSRSMPWPGICNLHGSEDSTMLKEIVNRDLVTVEPDARIRDVARLMQERNVGAILVLTDGKPRGIITDRDIV